MDKDQIYEKSILSVPQNSRVVGCGLKTVVSFLNESCFLAVQHLGVRAGGRAYARHEWRRKTVRRAPPPAAGLRMMRLDNTQLMKPLNVGMGRWDLAGRALLVL